MEVRDDVYWWLIARRIPELTKQFKCRAKLMIKSKIETANVSSGQEMA